MWTWKCFTSQRYMFCKERAQFKLREYMKSAHLAFHFVNIELDNGSLHKRFSLHVHITLIALGTYISMYEHTRICSACTAKIEMDGYTGRWRRVYNMQCTADVCTRIAMHGQTYVRIYVYANCICMFVCMSSLYIHTKNMFICICKFQCCTETKREERRETQLEL